MSQDRSRKSRSHSFRTTLFWAVLLSLPLAALGSALEDGPFERALFFSTYLQYLVFGLIVAFQRLGLLKGIISGVLLAFLMILLFQGQMAKYYWMGEFFLSCLKMLIVPLVVFAMVSGITGLGDIRKLGRLGGMTLGYFLSTTLLAVILGVTLVNLIQPGVGLTLPSTDMPIPEAAEQVGFSSIILSFVSDNIMKSFAELDMLPIILFSLFFGGVLSTTGEKGKVVIAFFEGANEAMMKLIDLVMKLAPIGVFALVAGKFGLELEKGGTEAFLAQLSGIAWYGLTVVLGLIVHGGIVLALCLRFLGKRRVLPYVKGLLPALLTAFSTGSSAATMPLTLKGLEEDNGVDPRAAQFVVPLGATVNMDGTALYEAVAAITIAQAYGIDLNFGYEIIIIVTSTLAAIGAAAIPEAGLVTMVMVLGAVGLPIEGMGLILVIDWLLDRCRTIVNVWGDAVGAAVVEQHALSPEHERD